MLPRIATLELRIGYASVVSGTAFARLSLALTALLGPPLRQGRRGAREHNAAVRARHGVLQGGLAPWYGVSLANRAKARHVRVVLRASSVCC